MLRWMMPFLIAMFAIPSAAEAAGPAGKAAARRAASQLPPGLPRPHYKFRTTVAPATPSFVVQPIYGAPEVLFTPSDGYIRYIPPVVGAAWLPGWGLPFDGQGPWYAGPDTGYWNRQPYGYAYGNGCGLYGYC